MMRWYLLLEALPSWILTTMLIQLRVLPKGHVWNERRFALADWAYNRTSLCRLIDAGLWTNGLLLVALIVSLHNR